MKTRFFSVSCAAVLFIIGATTPAQASLFQITGLNSSFNNVGGYMRVFGNDPNSSPGQVDEILNMGNQNTPDTQSGAITAGQLFTTFQNAGISQANSLILSLGINQSGPVGTNWVDVEALTFRIEDPNNPGSYIVDIGLDNGMDNTVRVFNYIQGQANGEAQFEIKLPFNFMNKFNANSTSAIELDTTVTHRDDGDEVFFFDTAVQVIPEPGSAAVLFIVAGIAGLTVRRRRRS